MPLSDHRSRAAATLYEAVTRLHGATRDDLVTATTLSAAEVTELLDQLVDDGLVEAEVGPPTTYRRTDVAGALAALAIRRRSELDRVRDSLDRDLGVLDVLLSRIDAPTGWRPRVERVDDLRKIRMRLAELHRTSSGELLAFDYGPASRDTKAQRREAFEASAALDRDWLARGGSMRTIFTEAILHDALAWAFTHRPISEGGLVRLSPTIPLQLLVIDRRIAVVQVDPADSAAGALFISEPGIVSSLIDLFEVYWMNASAVDAPPGRDADSLTAQQRAVLRLLELGHKDESIARHLGVSLRTASRVIAEALDQLGAESRFQAGVLAARRGWL